MPNFPEPISPEPISPEPISPEPISAETVNQIAQAVQQDRLVETAVALIETPSPTRSAAAVADRLAEILHGDGFDVERADCGWPDSPAIICRFDSGQPGQTIQFNGHLDTVHLPFVPPRIENGVLYGSGCSDMKGGIAAFVEATRVLRETGLLTTGSVLMTAHDLHELPWGDGSQAIGLIDAGYVGDGVLLPEYLGDFLPLAGRGMATLTVTVTREGHPVHEVLGGFENPNVIAAGAEIAQRLIERGAELKSHTHPIAGHAGFFVGEVHSGEIFNQSPVEFRLGGTRRWLPGDNSDEIHDEYFLMLDEIAARHGVTVGGEFQIAGEGFEIDEASPLVAAVQSAHSAVSGEALPTGAKPFVDDGNKFVHRAGIPAVTHGPNATGAHTVNEEVPISELVRVANVYALTAIEFCGGAQDNQPEA
jgi:acetylornithine deacetylase/succinyl-diaminopimelate desuccinylase-like protein